MTQLISSVTDVVGRWRLRSATRQLMAVPSLPWHRLSTVGRRAFAVHGPMVWNSLPDDLCAQQDYVSFKQGRNLALGTSVHSALETSVIIALCKSTYVLYYTVPSSFIYWHWHYNAPTVFIALHVMQTRYSDEKSVRPSVRPSVRLSVTRANCDKTEERSVYIFIPYER